MPSKKLSFQEVSPPEETLNLANLKSYTVITYIKDINQPNLPISDKFPKIHYKCWSYTKLITSVKESNSLPTLEVPCNQSCYSPI